MYDLTRIQTGFKNLVGWRTPNNPDFAALGSSVTTTNSGQYFQDEYPFLSIEYMDAIGEDFDNMELATYAAGTTYGLGDKVLSSSRAYISLQAANIGNTPADEPTWWRPLLEAWLLEVNQQVAVMVIEDWLNAKKLNKSIKALYDQVMIFDGAGSLNNTVIQESRFVGMKITPAKYNSVIVDLNYAGLQATLDQTNLTFYLFHSSRQDAVATFTKSTTAGAKNFEWFAVGQHLEYANLDSVVANQREPGHYFFGYFEDDLNGQALYKDYDFSKDPCDDCNKDVYNKWSYNIYNKFCKVEPIEVASGNLNGIQLWDAEDTEYPRTGNFGLNLNISVRCEVTDILLTEKLQFTQAVIKKMAIWVLRQMLWSTRMNKIEQTAKQLAQEELKGITETNFYGIEAEYLREIKALDIDFSEFDSPCWKRVPSRGLRSGSF